MKTKCCFKINNNSLPTSNLLPSRVSLVGEGDLRILDAQRESSGTYTCTATNRYATDSVAYHLHVLGEWQSLSYLYYLTIFITGVYKKCDYKLLSFQDLLFV